MKKIVMFFTFLLFCEINEAQIYHLQELTTLEISALDRDKTVVLIPGGILEQHGPYLPSFSDGYMNLALTEEIANSIVKREGWKALIFPLIPLGNGGANIIGNKYSYSGTYAIRENILRSVFMDLSSELGEQGFDKIFVIHIHGGPNHNLAIDQAADYFKDIYNGRMVNIWNLAFYAIPELKSEDEQAEDGFTVHAGMDETSIILHLRPELVKKGYSKAPPVAGQNFNDLINLAREKDWPGYFGSPRLASAVYGEQYWKAWTSMIIRQTEEILNGKYDYNRPTYFQIMSDDPSVLSVIEGARKSDKERESRQDEWLRNKGLE